MSGETAPLLSICIPTLNRANFIGATLDSILDQLEGDMEIVIVDGGSKDGTAEVVAQRSARAPIIRYHLNEHLTAGLPRPADAGFDRDCDYCLKLAKGKYCWILPDDDLLVPDAIRTVKGYLASGLALILVNAQVFDRDMTHCLEATRLNIRQDVSFAAGEDDRLFALAGVYLTYVGGVVVRRDFWLRHARPEFYRTDFIHLLTLFSEPGELDAVVVARPLVSIRYGNAQWRHRAFQIWVFNWPALVWGLPLSDAAKVAVVPRYRWRSLKILIVYRALGAYGPDEFRQIQQENTCTAMDAILAKCIAWLPVLPLTLGLLGVLAVIGKRNSMGSRDLLDAIESPFVRRSSPA